MQLKPILFILSFFLLPLFASANLSVYKGGTTLITGTWVGNCTLAETSANNPYEGTQHYQMDYNFTNWWSGVGLNMDNWGSSAAKDFSGYTHLRIAYRGLTSGQMLVIKLRNDNLYSNEIQIGATSSAYQVVDISFSSLLLGTSLNANAVREIDVSVTSTTQSGSGAVFFDAIELVNVAVVPLPPASPTTWARANAMGKGFNTANWLEAHWLLPFNAYPVQNDYTRAKFQFLKSAGFQHVRLPVIFERLGSLNPPYTLNTNQTAFYLVDSVITWANTFNLKLIIDNHHGDPQLTDANYQSQIPRLCAVWKQLALRYNYLDPNRFLFEIYNEPNGITNNNFRIVAQTVMDTIRKYDTTHTYFVGGNGWNSIDGLTSFQPLNDNNVIYTFHCYDPYFFTHQGMSWTSPSYFAARSFPLAGDVNYLRSHFQGAKSWGTTNSVPIYMGEYGAATTADATSRCAWFNLVTHLSDSLTIPWAYWDAKNWSDAFGIFTNGVLSQANLVPCIQTSMGLFAAPLALDELTNQEIQCKGKTITLRWEAAVHRQAGIFHIETSKDGVVWQAKHQVRAQLEHQSYEVALENEGTGQNYYRIVYEDLDGKETTLPVITVSCANFDALAAYPNPITEEAAINIDFTSSEFQNARLRLLDLNGRILYQNNILAEQGNNHLQVPIADLAAGMYQLQLLGENGVMRSLKVVKQ
jgi:endoglucanase